MDKRSRRRFTKEFKVETVALIRQSGKSIAEVCRDMGLGLGPATMAEVRASAPLGSMPTTMTTYRTTHLRHLTGLNFGSSASPALVCRVKHQANGLPSA